MASVRTRNARIPFEIHHDREEANHDDTDELAGSEADQVMAESQQTNDYDSDSEESEDSVEPSVQEDMEKFQQTFKGIADRFRLINRIGEGIRCFDLYKPGC